MKEWREPFFGTNAVRAGLLFLPPSGGITMIKRAQVQPNDRSCALPVLRPVNLLFSGVILVAHHTCLSFLRTADAVPDRVNSCHGKRQDL